MQLFYFVENSNKVEAHKLSEVNNYIKQVISLNFEDSLWVMAEISQIKFSGKHVYLELIEKDDQQQEVIASVGAVIWFQSFQFIKNKLGDLAKQILTDGTQIQCKVKIDFHTKYGLKFVLQDIDPSYTFGQLEIERQKTIEQLQKEDLIGKNKGIQMPLVVQRIAVISSEKAAGLQDFLVQLSNNPYEYDFEAKVFHASVQGNKLEKEILNRMDEIENLKSNFDCVVIIRGGGSKLDLSGFDSLALSRRAANYPLPVITGIGHDIDHNVIEMVVHSPLKTPTAAANYILDHNLLFESEVLELNQQINHSVIRLMGDHAKMIEQSFLSIKMKAWQFYNSITNKLYNTSLQISHNSDTYLNNKNHEIDSLVREISLTNPMEILKKGYSLIYQEGAKIKKGKDIKTGEKIEVYFIDGKLKAEAEEFNQNIKEG